MKWANKKAPGSGKHTEAKEIVKPISIMDWILTQPSSLAQEMENCAIDLANLAGGISESQWKMVQDIRARIFSLAEQVGKMEKNLVINDE